MCWLWSEQHIGVPDSPHCIIAYLSVELGKGSITPTIHSPTRREGTLRGWGHRLPLVTSTRKLSSQSTAILRRRTYKGKEKSKISIHNRVGKQSDKSSNYFSYSSRHFSHCPCPSETSALTCAKTTAGTHGAAGLRPGLADGRDADRATQHSRAHMLNKVFSY